MKNQALIYVVWRVGSNAANQSMQQRRAIFTVEVPKTGSPKDRRLSAIAAALADGSETVYANQHLEAESKSAAFKSGLSVETYNELPHLT